MLLTPLTKGLLRPPILSYISVFKSPVLSILLDEKILLNFKGKLPELAIQGYRLLDACDVKY